MVMNSIGVLGLGVFMLFRTWFDIFRFGVGTDEHMGAYIFKSIDIILVGLVLFIFGTSLKSLIKKKSSILKRIQYLIFLILKPFYPKNTFFGNLLQRHYYLFLLPKFSK